jgi:hypothetical protein
MPKSQAAISTCVFAARAEPVTKPTSMTRGCAHRQILPRPSRLRAIPISRRCRRAPYRQFDRGQRLSPRDHRRRHNRQGFPDLAATNLAALALREFARVDSEAKRKRAVVRTVERVAKHLGNTPGLPAMLHPPGDFRGFPRWHAARDAGGKDPRLRGPKNRRHER